MALDFRLTVVMLVAVAVIALGFFYVSSTGFLSLAGFGGDVSGDAEAKPLNSGQKLAVMDKVLEESRGLKEILEEKGKSIESIRQELIKQEFTSEQEVQEFLFDSVSQKCSADISPEECERLGSIVVEEKQREVVVVNETYEIGGKTYTSEELLSMPEAERRALYEQYKDDYPGEWR